MTGAGRAQGAGEAGGRGRAAGAEGQGATGAGWEAEGWEGWVAVEAGPRWAVAEGSLQSNADKKSVKLS